MASTIPIALDELVRMAKESTPGVQVFDGPPPSDSTENDFIAIGYSDETEGSVESSRSREQLTAEPDREVYDVVCLCSAWSGDSDMSAIRKRAYALLDAFAAVLAADQTLSDRSISARLASESLFQDQGLKGSVATVRFLVHIDAFTS